MSRHAAFASPPQFWSLVRQACMRDLTKDDDTKVFIIMHYKVSGIIKEKKMDDAYRRFSIVMCWQPKFANLPENVKMAPTPSARYHIS